MKQLDLGEYQQAFDEGFLTALRYLREHPTLEQVDDGKVLRKLIDGEIDEYEAA